MKGRLFEDNKLFILIHFEQIFENLFLDYSPEAIKCEKYDMDKRGIYQYVLNQSTANSIMDFLKDETGKEIYMFWDGIYDFREDVAGVLKDGIEIISSSNNIIFVGVSGKIRGWLLDKKRSNIWESKNITIVEDGNASEPYKEKLEQVILDKFRNDIRNCCEEYNDLSPSSKVILTKYVDIKKLMLNVDDFSLYVYYLSRIAIRKELLNTYNDLKNYHFLVHTINGAIIGTILSQLFGISITKIDHLGPKSELIQKGNICSIERNANYITVSDVICMGREIEAAKTALKVFGANYKGSICLLSFSPVSAKQSDKIYSILDINKDNNFIDYVIETELCSRG